APPTEERGTGGAGPPPTPEWGEGLVSRNCTPGVEDPSPPAVTTTTSIVSTASAAGDAAVIDESSFTVNPAGVSPKLTAATSMKFVPVIVTSVPPLTGPRPGLMPDTAGASDPTLRRPTPSRSSCDRHRHGHSHRTSST